MVVPVEVEEGKGSAEGVGFGEGLVVGLLLELELEQVETGSSLVAVTGFAGAVWLVPLASWPFW